VNYPLADPQDSAFEAKLERHKERHRKRLLAALRSIAKDRGLEGPKLEAETQRIERSLLRHIAHHEDTLLRARRYWNSTDPWRRAVEKPDERWARYLVRLENNRAKLQRWISRLKESQPLKRKGAIERKRKEWIKDAASVRLEPKTIASR
jgi:hypothetical protein